MQVKAKMIVMCATLMTVLTIPAFAGPGVPTQNVPEPVTLSLLAVGLGGLAVLRKFRKH